MRLLRGLSRGRGSLPAWVGSALSCVVRIPATWGARGEHPSAQVRSMLILWPCPVRTVITFPREDSRSVYDGQ